MDHSPFVHCTGRKLKGVELVPEHVMAQEAVYALQVRLLTVQTVHGRRTTEVGWGWAGLDWATVCPATSYCSTPPSAPLPLPCFPIDLMLKVLTYDRHFIHVSSLQCVPQGIQPCVAKLKSGKVCTPHLLPASLLSLLKPMVQSGDLPCLTLLLPWP